MMQEPQNRVSPQNSAPADLSASHKDNQTVKFLLAHLTWTLIAATGGVYFLANAESNSDINVWGGRLLAVLGIGLLGSFAIMVAWMGKKTIGTARFWGAWVAVLMVGAVVGPLVAFRLVPL